MGLSILAHFTLRGSVPEVALDAATALGAAAGAGIIHWTMWLYIRDLDELHQRMMFEAYTFAFLTTMTVLVLAGVFGLSSGATSNVLWIYAFGEAMRGLGLVLAGRRYQ
jgi:hypothetical protein